MASEQHHNSSMEDRLFLVKDWINKCINVDALFTCAICHGSFDDHPTHCPQCSKLYCGECFDQWLTSRFAKRSLCCQKHLEPKKFVCCRVYQDVDEMIEGLRDNVAELIRLVSKIVTICAEHGKELLLFCGLCKQCMCIKCVFSDRHRDHNGEILDLDDAREMCGTEQDNLLLIGYSNNMTSEQHSSSIEERLCLAKEWFNKRSNVEQLFICAICHGVIAVDHPIHCPHCSKLFCGKCMDQWLTSRSIGAKTKRCPCCQAQVEPKNFVRCRIYQDVDEMIEGLKDNLVELIHLVTKTAAICVEHGKELLLFCESCKGCLCIKCLCSDPHRSHNEKILDLDNARETFRARIEKKDLFLTGRLKALQKAGEQIETNECDMMDANEHIVEEINYATERIVDKLREEMHERFRQHVEPVKIVTKQQRSEVEGVIQKVSELANEVTSPEVVMETFQVADIIKKMNKEPLPVLKLPATNFIDPITPPMIELKFFLRNFSKEITLNRKIFSEKKSIEGYSVQLMGNQEQDDNGNDVIKLSLLVVDGYDVHDVKVTCYPVKGASVEPLARRMDLKLGENNTVLEFGNFQAMKGFLDKTNDKLYLLMKFRLWATYYDKCVHKDWYIAKLTGARKRHAGKAIAGR
ncbi:E3 ubiquitin-protein ligase TRIM37-like isoform X2 [Topomyia yanbarensis]|nr:E3 ubiquitin-protein ligase TRIM37-like isoform X2 [Topomyia yanbarensis]XP_058834817.1 E3 ubiquitin-protein ligase TRIM37-like isoform X2 [Topomyia yanbarensis]